jgi:membrane protease YdiL (CAAX protease family)
VTERARWYGRGDLGASLVLIFPLLLAYELGIAFAGRVAGADSITRALYALAGGREGYLVLHACIAIAFLVWMRATRRDGVLRAEIVVPVVLEAAVYALTLGAVIALVVDRALGLGAGGTIVSAIGAGVHEELAFRLALTGGLVALLWRARSLDHRLAVAIAIAIASLLFATAHHVGTYGEPFVARVFAARAVAGVVFGAICWFRSLAHAVYAHAIYDVLVAL